MSKEDDRVDKKTLVAQRTYRVSTRMDENFPQIRFFVSNRAHLLYHLQKTLYPEFAGKVDVSKMNIEELRKLPKGFRLLDDAIKMRYNRDAANYVRIRFNTATQEELMAAKFSSSKGLKKIKKEMLDLMNND